MSEIVNAHLKKAAKGTAIVFLPPASGFYSGFSPSLLSMMGAAMGTIISSVLVTIMYSIAVYRRSRIHPIPSAYIKPVLGSILVGLIMHGIVKGLSFFSFWLMPAYLALFLLGYAGILLLIGSLEREDIFLLEAISGKTGLQLGFLKTLILRFSQK